MDEAQARMQEAVQGAAEEAGRHEREAADRRVIAAEKDVLLKSQMCDPRPPSVCLSTAGHAWKQKVCHAAMSTHQSIHAKIDVMIEGCLGQLIK